jgi:EAL domain-containing protein (putative c-di-GMP-specific phosphodiesterase class I)
VLERLAAMGAGLALDDFGTGYSALSYLQRFPFDTVKVDKSFVAGSNGGNAPVILRSIVNMAHDLNMRVVAEGVESPEDVAFLRQIGCEYGQGFHYSPPLSPDEAMQFLTEWR